MEHEKVLKEIVEIISRENGSDIHLSEDRNPTIRVNGELIPLTSFPKLVKEDTIAFLNLLLTEPKKKEFDDNMEVDFSYQHSKESRFRGNAFIQRGRFGIVMRLIPKSIKTLEELNIPTILADFARMTQGFFLIVGPVGQGKTTTLAALIDMINIERAEHIITIENPIEYIYEQKRSIVDQREIGIDTNDFHSALVSTLRQDVDVILVGEMRDYNTMAAAITAAETGHLVLSTLHTNNASQTIDRIIDSFPAAQQDQIRVQLSSSLTGIFSQRLLPRISGGMIPAFELLVNNNAVSNLIRESRTHEIDTVIETGSESGMIDMNRSLAELVRKGEITYDTAKKYSLNPQLLERLI
jgi:twitching motility protein PilT